jgi:hypothetical protein
MPWRLVSRKQQKDSKLGSREVRGPLNKRGSCRTFFFSDDSCRTLGVLEKNDVRPSVSRSVLLTSILVILYLETGPSIGVIVSPFFFTANICTIQMCTHDTYTRNTIILLLCVSAQFDRIDPISAGVSRKPCCTQAPFVSESFSLTFIT